MNERTIVQYSSDGIIDSEEWFEIQSSYLNIIYTDVWMSLLSNLEKVVFGRNRHRIDGPAITMKYSTGEKFLESWYENDFLHRENGPAFIIWNEDGSIKKQQWYNKGKRIYL